MDFDVTISQGINSIVNIVARTDNIILQEFLTVGSLYSAKVTTLTNFYPIELVTFNGSLSFLFHHVEPIDMESTLTVGQQIIILHDKTVVDKITVRQLQTTKTDPTRIGTSSIGIGQYITVWVDRHNSQGDFEYVDETIKGQYDALSPPGKVTLTYQTLTLDLPTPEFGNKITYTQYRVQGTTRGGDLIIYYDRGVNTTVMATPWSRWPTTEVLEFDFSYLDDDNSALLLAFLLATLGRKITLVDYLGLTWQGFILNPELEILQAGRFNWKSNTIKFQGVLQS